MFVFAITYARILATSAIASLIVCAYIGIHYRIMTNVNVFHNLSLEVLLGLSVGYQRIANMVIWRSKTDRFAVSNGPFRMMKWTVSQCEMGCYGIE